MPTLHTGVTGDDVRRLQQFLASQGYDVGAIDGDFGRRTRAAVMAFQQRMGLDVDGIVGPDTRRAMQSAQAPAPLPQARPTPSQRQPMTDMWALPGNLNNGRRAPPPPPPAAGPAQLRANTAAPPNVAAPASVRPSFGSNIPVPPPGGQGRNYQYPPPPPRPVPTTSSAPEYFRPDLVNLALSTGRHPSTYATDGPRAIGFPQMLLDQSPVANMPDRITAPAPNAPANPVRTVSLPSAINPGIGGVPGSMGAFSPQMMADAGAPAMPSRILAQANGPDSFRQNQNLPHPMPSPDMPATPPMPGFGVPRLASNAVLPQGGRSYDPPLIMNAQPQTDTAGTPLYQRAQEARERLLGPQNTNAALIDQWQQMGLPPEIIQRLIEQLRAPLN